MKPKCMVNLRGMFFSKYTIRNSRCEQDCYHNELLLLRVTSKQLKAPLDHSNARSRGAGEIAEQALLLARLCSANTKIRQLSKRSHPPARFRGIDLRIDRLIFTDCTS